MECENLYNIEKFTGGPVSAVFPGVFRFLDQLPIGVIALHTVPIFRPSGVITVEIQILNSVIPYYHPSVRS